MSKTLPERMRTWVKYKSWLENGPRDKATLSIRIEGIDSGDGQISLVNALKISSPSAVTSKDVRDFIGYMLSLYDAVTPKKFKWRWYVTNGNDIGIYVRVHVDLKWPDAPFDNLLKDMKEI